MAALFAKLVYYFNIVIKLMPYVIRAILELENLIPEAKRGSDKAKMIHDTLEVILGVVGDGKVTYAELKPIIQKLIDKKVAEFNSSAWPPVDSMPNLPTGGV